jgi:hypothetical protein
VHMRENEILHLSTWWLLDTYQSILYYI